MPEGGDGFILLELKVLEILLGGDLGRTSKVDRRMESALLVAASEARKSLTGSLKPDSLLRSGRDLDERWRLWEFSWLRIGVKCLDRISSGIWYSSVRAEGGDQAPLGGRWAISLGVGLGRGFMVEGRIVFGASGSKKSLMESRRSFGEAMSTPESRYKEKLVFRHLCIVRSLRVILVDVLLGWREEL
jgi:hypothetical protein